MATISSNGYVGYHNYMKYWAKNGEYNWICNTSEYTGPQTSVKIVEKTYMVKSFWTKYDGTTSPLNGAKLDKTANGFEK